MSLPSMRLVCDRCGDGAKLGPFPRAFYLTEKDGPLPVRWTLGWCADCRQARQIEDWPYKAALDAEGITLLAEALAWKEQQKAAEAAPRGWLSRLFGRGAGAAEPEAVMPQAQALADLRLYHWLLDTRQSPNRCMQCGSTHVWHWYLDKEPQPEHPECGGRFRHADDVGGMRLNFRGLAALYDLEGNHLARIQTSAPNGRPTVDDLASGLKAQSDDWLKAPTSGADRSGPNNAREGT